jgi:phenylacetate-CoA ligase
MFVVRGENVYPSAIEDVIRGIKGFGDEYRIIITREKTMHELIVQDNLDYKGVKIPLSI